MKEDKPFVFVKDVRSWCNEITMADYNNDLTAFHPLLVFLSPVYKTYPTL